MTFKKGQSGNPNGRPRKIVEDAKHSLLLDLFDEQAERAVINNMLSLARTKIESSSVAVNAATWLWERKYGKVKDIVELYGDILVKGYATVSPDDWTDEPQDTPD